MSSRHHAGCTPVPLAIETILDRLRGLDLPPVDGVIAIERGGRIPAALTAAILGVPLGRIRIRYRDDGHTPLLDRPEVVGDSSVPPGRRLLVVDDVAVTGATLATATRALSQVSCTTLVVRGQADLVVFPEIDRCIEWPWS